MFRMLVAGLVLTVVVTAAQAQYPSVITGTPRPFGGYNLSDGTTITPRPFGGFTINPPKGDPIIATPRPFGGFNFSDGSYTTPRPFGGFDYYRPWR